MENLPPLGLKNAKLKFAPKDAPELGITRGMTIGGLLYFESGSTRYEIAQALLDVSMDGIIGRGDVAAFEIGPVKLQEAAVDLTLTRDVQHCIIAGRADLGFMNSHVDLSISKTSAHFETEAQIFNAFKADVKATGTLDAAQPQFLVEAKMQNDFNGKLAKELSAGITAAVAESKNAAAATADAASRKWNAAVVAKNRAHDAWANTPLFPREEKVAKRRAWTSAITTATRLGAAKVMAEGVARRWSALYDLVSLAGGGSGGMIVVNRADFKADLVNLKGGSVKQMHLNLTFRNQPVDLNLAGWNFKDMSKSLKEAANSLADQLIASVK